MKKILVNALVVGALLTACCASFAGGVYVQGYMRSNGTYVQPYMRSAPDGNTYNNWSTQGNVNPYTGAVGTKQPQAVYQPAPVYVAPKIQPLQIQPIQPLSPLPTILLD